jgi:hypothetical protein
MSPIGFEAMIPAGALPQTYAVDRAATGIGPKPKMFRLSKDHLQGVKEATERSALE